MLIHKPLQHRVERSIVVLGVNRRHTPHSVERVPIGVVHLSRTETGQHAQHFPWGSSHMDALVQQTLRMWGLVTTMYGSSCRSMSRRASLFGSSRWTWRALRSTRLWSDSARLPKASICCSDSTSTGSSAYCRKQAQRQDCTLTASARMSIGTVTGR